MNIAELLIEEFDRIADTVDGVLDGIDPTTLTGRIDPDANTVAWLVWHLTRVQDDHIADLAGRPQVWHDGWSERFGLPFDDDETGYGADRAGVAAVDVAPDLLTAYHRAVRDATVGYLRSLQDGDLDRVVDEDWDPPVTVGVRLVSVIADDLQHVGQAAYVRGSLERSTG